MDQKIEDVGELRRSVRVERNSTIGIFHVSLYFSFYLADLSAIYYHLISKLDNNPVEGVTYMDPNDKWLTIEELASYLKMSRTKLYQMAQKSELPASKIGTQWRFDRNEIDDWVKSQRPARASRHEQENTTR